MNPCKGREDGCTQDPPVDGGRCDSCRALHNAREASRRAERKAAAKCTVCGGRAVVLDGAPLTLCKTHREYYRARDEAYRNA